MKALSIAVLLCLCPLTVEGSGWVITEDRVTTIVRTTPKKTVTSVRSRWNVDGNWQPTEIQTREHLERTHGVSVGTMSHQEMRTYHDSLHDGRSRTPFRHDVRTRSSCPGGVCPPQRRLIRIR